MRVHLIIFVSITLLLLCLVTPVSASINFGTTNTDAISDMNLPSALSEDDSFEDLPFEQLRQALREEVEHGPQKGLSPRSFKRYNLLIR